MKTYTHIIYLLVIMLLAVAFILKTTNCPEPVPPAKKTVHWTFDIDYESLNPMPRENTELRRYLRKVENLVANHDWEGFIQECAPNHYEDAIEFFTSEKYKPEELTPTYILYTLQVFPAWEDHITIPNYIGDPEIIKRILFVGIDPEFKSEETTSFYGYLETTKGIMLAVNVWVTDRNGKYEITAPLG